jgi:medium-chain acyl-[acyl-carrier-protein] hydrolase
MSEPPRLNTSPALPPVPYGFKLNMTAVDNIVPWLSCYRPNPAAKLRLFCFPYAGGGAHIYRNWFKSLPAHVEVCPVHLPGRGSRQRETPFIRMELLAKAVLSEMRSYLDKPFAFFGHSMGAVISFEIARLLRREEAALPVHLFISGRSAPQIQEPKMQTYDLPDAAFMEELLRLKGTPSQALEHRGLMEVVMPLLRADFELIQTYAYTDEPPLNVPLTAIGGLEDEISREDLDGWRAQTTRAFSLWMLAGDHFYLTKNQQLLLPLLTQELSRNGFGK